MIVAIEGIHSSGKSTLVQLLSEELSSRGYDTTVTKWNSYGLVSPVTTHLRRKGLLDNPSLYFLIQLTDFAFRYEHIIQPALTKKKLLLLIVIFIQAYLEVLFAAFRETM